MPRYVRSQLWWSEQLQTYELSLDGVPGEQGLTLDWLQSIASFSFRSRDGEHYTLRKQVVQRGSTYWYAYRRLHGRVIKRYVGRTTDLSIPHLEAVARLFADEVSPSTSPLLLPPSEKVVPRSSENQLLFSKLSPPRLPALIIERQALLRRLDTSLFHALTLLQTPAGSGKTTIVAQWLAERRAHIPFPRVVWLSLDAGDNDPLRFWRTLIMASQALEITVGQTALTHLAEAVEPPFQAPSLETIVTSFLHDLAQKFSDGLFILDDYHTIKEPRIHESITFFIDHLPSTLRVMLLSRVEPPLPLLRWRAKGVLFDLSGTDLRFSLQETTTFLHQAHLPPLSETTLVQLDTVLEGWATGLRLLAHMLQGRQNALEVTHTLIAFGDYVGDTQVGAVHQQILDYLITEVFQAQTELLQHFLLQTSMLSHLHASLCDVVIGEDNSALQLEALARAGLFLEAIDREVLSLPHISHVWYRYHALWASALRREAVTRLGEETLRVLSSRASHWYAQHDMIPEAIDAALRAHDFEYAALLVEQADRNGLISEPHTLRRWLSPIPEEIFARHPMLCWLSALSLQLLQDNSAIARDESTRVEVLLDMADQGWRNSGNLAFLGLIDAFHALNGWRKNSFSSAVEYAHQALTRLVDDGHTRRIRRFRSICFFIVGASQMYAGCFTEARRVLLEAYTCSIIDGGSHFTRGMLLLLGVCSYFLNELYQSQTYYQQALTDARRQNDLEVVAEALLGLANIEFEWNQLVRAEHQVDEAISLVQEEDTDLYNRAIFQRARLCYAREQFTAARQQFATLIARLQVSTVPQAVQLLPDVYLWQARCALAIGDLSNVQRFLEMPDQQEQIGTKILQARLLLIQNEPKATQQHLLPLLSEAEQRHRVMEIQILLALAYSACQEERSVWEQLQQALSQGCSEGLIRPFVSEGEPLAHLLRQLLPDLQKPALRSYVQTILQAFQFPDGETSIGGVLPEIVLTQPLSSQERRVLKLLVAGFSNHDIAQELVVSINTVKDHVKHLYRKLGVRTRLQASEQARLLDLV